MTLAIVRPNGEDSGAGWAATGGTLAAVVRDNSDATYIADTVGVGFGTAYEYYSFNNSGFVLPARAVVKSVTPKVRCAITGAGAGWIQGRIFHVNPTGSITDSGRYSQPISAKISPTVTITNYAFPAGGEWVPAPDLTAQQLMDNLEIWITNGTGVASTHRVYDVWLEVLYDEAPTVTGLAVDAVLSNTATTRPKLVWAYADAEGDPQTAYQVVTYPTSVVTALGLTNPWEQSTNGSLPSGYVDNYTSTGAGLFYQVVNALQNGTAYTTFVRVADATAGGNRYGPASSVAYTITVTQPITPVAGDLTLVYDSARQRVQVNALAHLNMFSQADASFETGTSAPWGAAAVNVTSNGVTSAQAADGTKSMIVTVAGAGAVSLDHGTSSVNFLPVTTGKTYTAIASFRAAVTVRTVSIDLLWYNNTSLLLTTTGAGSANTTSGWTQVSASAAAPATANRLVVRLKWNGGAAAEVQYVDKTQVVAGTSTVWSQGVAGVGTIYLERSYDGGTTWFSVLTVSGSSFSTTDGTLGPLYDVVLSPNRSTLWRMSINTSVTVSGQTVPLVSALGPNSSPIVTTFTTWMLRDPNDVESEVVIPLTGDFDTSAAIPQGKFKGLGSTREVVISDVSTGETISATAVFGSQAAYDKFEALRKSPNALLLESDMTGVVFWVEPGPDRKSTLYRRQGRIAAATRAREVQIILTEVDVPAGQPTAA